jgi:hypothetical protein
MQNFERSVLIVALLILIVTLAVMGIALKQNSGKAPSPPAACPDFWFSSYFKPCSLSPYGCCADGVTPGNATKSNCESTLACNLSEFGCCADGYTAKTSSDGANCADPGPAMCYNVHKLPQQNLDTSPMGDCKIKNPEDFAPKNGKSTLCLKQEWAKMCSVSWDGVSNVSDAC